MDLRVLFVAPRYYPYVGGVEHVVKAIAERLDNSVVLCGDPNITNLKEEEINGVCVYRWPTYSPSNAYHIPKKIPKLKDFIKNLIRNVDIVHIHSVHAIFSIFVGLYIKEMNDNENKKIVFTPHYIGYGKSTIRRLLWAILWKKYVDKLINCSEKVQLLSDVEKELFFKHFRINKDKVVLIPNGVEKDVLSYKHSGNGNYIFFSGRIEKYKRVHLIPSLAEYLGLEALIVGHGKFSKNLKKHKNITLLPPQPRSKYLKLLADAKYSVNLSRDEALSIFVLESLAVGTPIIVSETIFKSISRFILDYELFKFGNETCYLINRANVPLWDEVVKDIMNVLYLS